MIMDITVPICNSNKDVACRTDALQAVKLDPAVLEAQITVDKQCDNSPAAPSPPKSENSLKSEPQVVNKPTEECSVSSQSKQFEDMMKLQKAAVLSLPPQQFDMLLKYAGILRMKRLLDKKQSECAFCKNNGEPESWYSLHMLKDKRGRVRCPVLRGYRCPICGSTGDFAHTIKYCPLADRDMWSS